jgi:predicted patatin/cPLA2 family phospholipase
MAGAVSAGFSARLETHGLRRIFDMAVASSAGAIVNTYFLANQAILGGHMIPTYLSHRGFLNDGRSRLYVDWRRALSKREHVWDLSMCLDDLMFGKCPINLSELISANIPNYCITSTDKGEPRILKLDPSSSCSIRQSLESTCRIPMIIDKNVAPQELDNQKLWDGSLITSAPIEQAQTMGATHFVVMRNYSQNFKQKSLAIHLIAALIGRNNRTLAQSFLRSQIASSAPPSAEQLDNILNLFPDISLGSFETNQRKIWKAMTSAFQVAGTALQLPAAPLPTLWLDQMTRDGIG